MLAGCRIVAIVALIASPASAATYSELQALVEGPWHHIPAPVAKFQQDRDRARCRLIAVQTPVDSTTSSVVAIVRWTAEVNCMQALGYAAGTGGNQATPRSAAKSVGLVEAGQGVGAEICAEFNRVAAKPEMEAIFLSWAQGMISGWNLALIDDHSQTVEMAALTSDEQKTVLRDYCRDNPKKKYIQATIALMNRFRAAKTP